ncbi:MAG: acetyl-CoA carboxylase biotin carboxylase subunit [Myxococcota bacterium]
MAFDKILIANRGEIARRIIRTCRAMGFETVAVHSEADADAPFVAEADEAVLIGPPPAAESYLVIDRILDAARRTGAGAIHPGYGFLSENADFAKACEDAGVIFVGPTSDAIAKMGSKVEAKKLMAAHGVPVIPGYDGADQDTETLKAEALQVGFPVLLKASAGGGGKGMRVVREEAGLEDAIDAARREAKAAFGDDTLLIEKYIERPRHVEFQILGDAHGNLVHLFERECSIQRRHQKIVEETPSPALTPALREEMATAAVRAGEALSYRSAGTVEFILAPDGTFYFLEVNTRLQVEHPVTEMTTGLDLVRLQLQVAAGRELPLTQGEVSAGGHSIECRLYAEDPDKGFLPATGVLRDFHFPAQAGLRLDSGVEAGDEVSVHYDPMLAKVVTWGETREEATRRMRRALQGASVMGVTTNRAFLLRVLEHEAWTSGELDTHFIERHMDGPTPAAPEEARRRALLVATLARTVARTDRPALLPGLRPGWRNNRWRDPEEAWRLGDDEVEVRYRPLGGDRYRLTVGEDTHDVRLAGRDGATWRVSVDGHLTTCRVVSDDHRTWVHTGEHAVALERVARFPEGAEEADAGGCVAPMPGKVLQLLVDEGQEVDEGQALVILEAMKMEHTLVAPHPAKVAQVLVEEGEQVDADATLVLLEQEGE